MLFPPRERSPSEDNASLLRRDVPPSRRAQTNGRTPYRRRREFPARDVQQLETEVEQGFWRQTRVSHQPPEHRASSRSEDARELRGEERSGFRFL